MHFADSDGEQIDIRIDNSGEIVHSQSELNNKVIVAGLLDGGGDV